MSAARILKGLQTVIRARARAVATVGVFDGVHRAHQRLIHSTVRLAQQLNGTSVVITFDPDPHAVLTPAQAQPALMPLDARLARIAALGVDRIWVIPFTRRFARLTAEQFIRRVLIRGLRASVLVVGERFVFGRDRGGDLDTLRALGFARGMRVIAVPDIRSAGQPVSSSRIRRLIAEGRLALAKRLLGRAPELFGVVVRGAGRGRRLGFPTANLSLTSQVLPPRGVYAVSVRIGRRPRPLAVVMNLGIRPTFGQGPLACEVHLMGFSGPLLGRTLAVSLLARLRAERCFPSPEALRRQIRTDVTRARRVFARREQTSTG